MFFNTNIVLLALSQPQSQSYSHIAIYFDKTKVCLLFFSFNFFNEKVFLVSPMMIIIIISEEI